MFACTDVHYLDQSARSSCVVFDDWTSASALSEHIETITPVEGYVPGEFYRRELPCLLAVLRKAKGPFDAIIVDGYVWLDKDRPGLGAYLFDELGRTIPVVGVAKSEFKGNEVAVEVLRGKSSKPLYVTSAGMDADAAAALVASMQGEYRIPTLLKRADELCRRGE